MKKKDVTMFLLMFLFLSCRSGISVNPVNQVINNNNQIPHVKVNNKTIFGKCDYIIEFVSGLPFKYIKSKEGFYIKPETVKEKVVYRVNFLKESIICSVEKKIDSSDFDCDGFPDCAELTSFEDRENFREWFTSIAETQYYKISNTWESIHHDCAGLIVFAYKEALKKHDNIWFKDFISLTNRNTPDIEAFNYPDIPILGEKLFRISNGNYTAGDENKLFFASSTANILYNFNLIFSTFNPEDAIPGDILIYKDTDSEAMPYHSMILLENHRVIYHTGPIDNKEGEVRMVKLADLEKHPDKKWHPSTDNPNFCGVYKWKILD